jgi:hypothetical protein
MTISVLKIEFKHRNSVVTPVKQACAFSLSPRKEDENLCEPAAF